MNVKEKKRSRKRSSKHEKVNGMVKWNYLGHRRTVDPNKVKGMAKITSSSSIEGGRRAVRDVCCTRVYMLVRVMEFVTARSKKKS